MNTTTLVAEPGSQNIVVTREFDAPRRLVFKAFTHSELVVQWMGPKDLETEIRFWEPRACGCYSFIQRNPKGEEFGFHGAFHEIKFNERIIETFEFEDMEGHVSLVTATFEELPESRTKITQQSVFQSVADRDAMLDSGMRNGVFESHERLDDLLDKLTTDEEERETTRDTI